VFAVQLHVFLPRPPGGRPDLLRSAEGEPGLGGEPSEGVGQKLPLL